jgi:hypothetical protein
MHAKTRKSAMTSLAAGLVLGGLVLGSLATTGCERMTSEEVAALASGSAAHAGDLAEVAQAGTLQSRIALNHNETFLIMA